MRRLQSLLKVLFRRRDFESRMAEEMRVHLELYAEDLIRSGVPEAEARRRARIEFGSVDNALTDCREARGLGPFDRWGQQLRYAARRLAETPGFTATAASTLALCLGANLTVFAVVDAVLLKPLPFPDAERLVRVFNTYPTAGVPDDGCSLPNYYERRGQLAAFAGLAAYREGSAIVGETGATEHERILRVTPDFFSTLGTGPALGRAFSDDETRYESENVAMVTDTFWRQRLGADPAVIGRTVRVNGLPRTVVGVLPPSFSFLSLPVRLFFPLASSLEERQPRQRHSGSSKMIGRLRPGATLEEAQAQVDAHNAAVEADNPQAPAMAEAGFRSRVVPLHADHVAALRPVLLRVQGGALFLALLGAVNLVHLLLIRASARQKELLVRRALGARGGHIAGEVVVEIILVALFGGLLGVGLAAGGVRLLAVLGASHLPLGARITFDLPLAATGILASLLCGLVIALPVVVAALRWGAGHNLGGWSRGATASRAVERLRQGLVVAEISLAFLLLVGSGLLAVSLGKVLEHSPGFEVGGVLAGRLSLPARTYPNGAAILELSDRLRDQLAREPGVVASGLMTNVPFSGISNKSAATLDHSPNSGAAPPHGIYSYSVDGDALEALGLRLLFGRLLNAADSRRDERVCVVDEDFARRSWPGKSAIGQRLFIGSEARAAEEAFTVVGVVGAAKQAELVDRAAQGAVYYPLGHRLDRGLFVVVRSSRAPERLATPLRDVVRGLDPELPVSDLRTMANRVADSLVARRSPTLLSLVFSVVAVLLTAVGTYGVLSSAVSQRRREIALRIAVGANVGQVRGHFVGLTLRLLGLGTMVGLAGAWFVGQALRSILFEVPALHLATLVGAGLILALVSLAAGLLPAFRAARISPLEALAEG